MYGSSTAGRNSEEVSSYERKYSNMDIRYLSEFFTGVRAFITVRFRDAPCLLCTRVL
jgi:hypothetical protein